MPDLPLVGTDFAGYRLRSVLGRGGMSVIYQAENPRLLNLIALKVLSPDLASDEVFRTRFREESQIAASLNHPNVIPIHDFGSYDGLLYIAMRYVSGTDLRHLIADHGRLAPEAAVYLLEQAARALDAAHSRGLVHRDVKPGNLLVAQSIEDGDPDHVYLADFGITKYVGGRTGLTHAGTVLGTVHYVSPEQIQEQAVFGAADQYSLGCVLYECLTGRAPFEKSSNDAIMWAHVHELPALPTMLRHDLPPAIDEVIARVLAKDPEDRYASCREFIADARDAIAPARSFQSAPVALGGFSGLVQPTVRDSRNLAAKGAPPSGPTDPQDAQPPSSPGDFRGQVDFGDGPVRGRRVRRRRSERPGARSVLSLAAIGGAVAVIAAASAAAGVFLSKTGNVTTPLARATHSAPPPASALYTALEGTSRFFPQDLQLSTCVETKSTLVQCTNPALPIASVSFRTYPTLSALYTDYQQIVSNLAGKSFADVENNNICGSVAPDPTGENTWDHSDHYYTKYSIPQLVSGQVSTDTAMGRVFCMQQPDGSAVVVWTQDSGKLLGYATGGAASHEEVWQWFYEIHHSIIFAGQPGMSDMPMSPTATGTGTPADAATP
jgi:serine/threonine-protein kinase